MAISLTKVAGPAHAEDRLLQHAQLQGRAGDRRRLVRDAQLPAGRGRDQRRSIPRSASPTRRSASFSSYQQASKYIEGNFVYDNREAYVQDNWKVSNRLTLDYGMRFVHALPQYDKLGQGSNFLPDQWSRSAAPAALSPGLRGHGAGGHRVPGRQPAGAEPVDRAAARARTRTLAIGTLVPGVGQPDQRLVPRRPGHRRHDVHASRRWRSRRASAWPTTSPATQKIVLRGGVGLFYDRPFGNSVIFMPGNPPTAKNVTVRYGQLQSLGSGGLTTQGAPALNTIEYKAEAAVVDAVERRHPDGDPVGDDDRRRVGRPAQLQHRSAR